MHNYYEFDNNSLEFVALTSDKNSVPTCKSIDESINNINRRFNYFGIRSNISYNDKEDLSFWEY